MTMKTIHQTLAALKGITFCSRNIRSLYPKLGEIKILLQQTGIDFLLLQDTFLDEHTSNIALDISDYNIFRLDRSDKSSKQGRGGLVCYVNLKHQVEHLTDWSSSDDNLEVQWLRLNLPETRPTYIGNLYRPPNSNLDEAISTIETRLDSLHSAGLHDVLLLGDTNIDLSRKGPSSNKLNCFFRNNILTQQVKKNHSDNEYRQHSN